MQYGHLRMNLCSCRLDVMMFQSKNKNWAEYRQTGRQVNKHARPHLTTECVQKVANHRSIGFPGLLTSVKTIARCRSIGYTFLPLLLTIVRRRTTLSCSLRLGACQTTTGNTHTWTHEMCWQATTQENLRFPGSGVAVCGIVYFHTFVRCAGWCTFQHKSHSDIEKNRQDLFSLDSVAE